MTEPMTFMLPPELIEALVDAVADRVLAVLAEQGRNGGPAEPRSPYLTVNEAAAFLRCKPQRIYDLLSARRLARIKDGSRTLVSRTEIESHLERGR